MSPRALINVLAIAVLALVATVVTHALRVSSETFVPRNAYEALREPIQKETLPDGRMGVRDARGELIPIGDYQRVVAGSTIASEVIHELLEPQRVVAYSTYARDHAHNGWKFLDRPHIGALYNVESILELQPDLVFFNGSTDTTSIARLTERGIQVFDLGPMIGMESFLKQAEEITTVLNVADRYPAYASAYRRRLQTVTCKEVPEPQTIAYIGMFGPSLFGGTVGTSYHDVILAAGMRDAAAEHYRGWPDYSPEDLLELDPPWMFTGTGGRGTICSHSALRNLTACREGGEAVVELPVDLLGDGGGDAILRSSELLFDAVYGPCDRVMLQDSVPPPHATD